MIRISVKRIHDPVSETGKVGISIGEFKDLLDHRVASFNRTVGDSDTVI